MLLDGLTLMVAGCFVAALAGILLMGAWVQTRGPALLWWSSGHLVNALAAAVIAVGLAQISAPIVTTGTGIATLSMTLYWAGVRRFSHRRPLPWVAAGAMGLWLGLSVITLGNGPRTSAAAAFLVTTLVLTGACVDLWRAREERLTARWGLITIFAIHAVYMAIGAWGLAFSDLTITATPSPFTWFGTVHFERLVFLIGNTLFMILMTRERQEMVSVSAARVDSLTGVANRGAFFSRADRILRRARENSEPVSLIVFDLDHFKEINDKFGHASGDRVLRAFTETASEIMRPMDLFGRIGGEEFAAVLPGATAEIAYVIADRVRHAFQSSPRLEADGWAIRATVSAGVAAASAKVPLETVMESADRALYRAKASGRNRVERAADVRAVAAAIATRVA